MATQKHTQSILHNPTVTTPWPFRDTIQVLIGCITMHIIILLLAGMHARNNTFDFLVSDDQTFNGVLIYIVSASSFLLPLWYYLLKGKKRTFSDFGLIKLRLFKIIQMVLLGYGLLFLLSIIVWILTETMSIHIPGLNPQEDVLPVFGSGKFAMSVAGIIAIIIAPILEEIFFRGFLLKSLMTKYPFYVASILTAGIFAFVHFQFESIHQFLDLSRYLPYQK